jgi:dTDP-4-amino-4,6-dideoxygalactose transaminase
VPTDAQAASDAVVFSFYATKNLTTGEGGMVTTRDESAAKLIRILSLHGISQDAWKRYDRHGAWYYEVIACGFKYNLSDIQAAIGIHQLRKLDNSIEARARYAAIYNEMLGGMEEIELPPDNIRCRHAWHLYILRLNLESLRIDREEFVRMLKAREIGTSVHFIPIPLHPYFARLSLARDTCPRSVELYPRIISLPLYPNMTEEQVRYVAGCVKEVVETTRKTRLFAQC